MTDNKAEIALALEYQQFKSALNDARGLAGGAFDGISRDASSLKSALAGLGGALSVAAFAGMVKGAIDGAEAMHDLSIKTGATVESLSGLAAVGKLTGTSADTIAAAMNKMAKATSTVDEEGKGAAQALRALGIDFDTFQALSPDEKMLTVAKAMDGFADGSGKSAAAMMLMGKQGADLLPYMKDLATVGELQAKVTTEQAAQADTFNDNLIKLKASGAGWSKELSFGMLPALSDTSEAVLSVLNGTGGLRDQIKALSADGSIDSWTRAAVTGLSYASDAVAMLWRGFKTLVELMTATAAAAVNSFGALGTAAQRALSGDFAGALDTVKTGMAGNVAIMSSFKETVTETFSEQTMGSKLRARMSELQGVQRAVSGNKAQVDLHAAAIKKDKEETAKLSEETKRLIAAWEAAEKAGEDLIQSTNIRVAQLQRELDLGRQLNPLERELIKLDEDIAAGKVIMSESAERALRAQIALGDELRKEIQWLRDTAAENTKAKDAQDKATEAVRQAAEKQREANTVLGLSKSALHDHELALIADKAAALDAKAANMDLIDVDMAAKLRAEAAEWRTLATLKAEAFDKKAALEFLSSANNAFHGLASGFVDAMMGGTDSVKDYLKRTLENLVIKVPLQYVASGVADMATAALAQALGLAPAGGAGGAGGGLLGTASNASTLYSALNSSTIGAALFGNSAAYGAAIGTTNVAAGSQAAMLAAQTGEFGLAGVSATYGAASGAGTAAAAEGVAGAAGAEGALASLGPYGWAALAVVALAAYLDKSGTPHAGGYALAGADGVTDITAQQGGMANPALQQVVSAFASSAAGMINDTAALFGQTASVAVRSVFESDGQDGSWGLFHVLDSLGNKLAGIDALGTLDSDPSKGFGQYTEQAAGAIRDALVAIDLPQWVDSTLQALGDAPGMQDLSKALEGIRSTQAALDDFAASMAPLGGSFAQIAGLSSDAKLQLVQFAGGIEAFTAKTQAYVKAYYSVDEQMSLLAKSILAGAATVGIDASMAGGRGDLRAAVEGTDLSTEAGRRQMNWLLSVANDFATLGEYLGDNGFKLGDVARGAPQLGQLTELLDPSEQTAAATQATADSSATIVDNTAATVDTLTAVVSNQSVELDVLAEGFTGLIESISVLSAKVDGMVSTTKAAAARGLVAA